MITVRMLQWVRTADRAYRQGETYSLDDTLALQWLANGWATRTSLIGVVSSANSTSVNLAGGGTFVGTAEDVLNYAAIIVSVHASHASATNGLSIWFSPDNVHWDKSDEFTLAANSFKTFTFQPIDRFFKIQYVNGATPTTQLHIQTQFRAVAVKASSHRLGDDISGQDDAELIKAVLAAEKPNGAYTNINATAGGNLKVSIEELDDALSPMPVGVPASSTDKDAFGRHRVSLPQVLGFGGFEYGLAPAFMESLAVGTGAVLNTVNEAALSLTTGGTAAGAGVTVQTRKFHRYVPGRSQLVRFTGSFGTPTANVVQRAGYFSDRDGVFMEYDGTTLNFVRRSYVSGAAVDVKVPRSQWSDPFDGSGPSGLTLDFSGGTTWLAWVDLEWLGVGRYRFGFASPQDGSLVVAYANAGTGQLSVPYMRTANLPVRYSIHNTGTAAQATTMKWICYSVDSEGGDEGEIPAQYPVDNGVTPQSLANGTFKPILAIRVKTTGPNGVPNRAQVLLKAVSAVVSGNNLSLFRLILNPTTLTQNGGAVSWVSASDLVEYTTFSTAGDTVAGGTSVGDSFYVPASATIKGAWDANLFRKFPLVYTELNSVQDVIVLAGAGVGSTSAALGNISYQELL